MYESKIKIDQSTEIIKTLESQLESHSNTLREVHLSVSDLAQLFENKQIEPSQYPLNVLLDYLKDKIKRL